MGHKNLVKMQIHKIRMPYERQLKEVKRQYNPPFYPIFQCGLWPRAINITDNLCAKQEKLSLKSAVYN